MRSYYSYMVFTFITAIVFSSCSEKVETKTPPSIAITEPVENSEFVKNTQIEIKIESLNGYGTQLLKSIDYYVDNIIIDQENEFIGGCFWQSTREDIGEHTFKVIVTAFNELQDEDEVIFSVTGPYEDYRSKYLGVFDFTSIRELSHDFGDYTYDTTYYLGNIRESYQSDGQISLYDLNNMISIEFEEGKIYCPELSEDGVLIDNNYSGYSLINIAEFSDINKIEFEVGCFWCGHYPPSYYVTGIRH